MKTRIILFLFLLCSVFSQAQSPTDNDFSFNPVDKGFGNGANDRVYTSAIQSDGKIIIGGEFTHYKGIARNHIARINTDGSLDESFNVGTGADTTVLAIILQSDGKIIISGGFTSYNGTSCNRIVRLNTDGSLDGTFITGTGANDIIHTIRLQSDGKIIIGGDFTNYNNIARNRIARLNANGNLDATFTPGAGANSSVYSSCIQADGNILIGGAFTNYNNAVANRIIRLHNDGSTDSTFNTGTGADSTVYTITIQSNGNPVIGGDFKTYNGINAPHLVRLTTNGSIDNSFFIGIGPGMGLSNCIRTITIQSDGKILMGGDFNFYNSIRKGGIARLNIDGTVDSTFNSNPGTGFTVYSITLQNDHKIIVGGWFNTYNETGKSFIVRIHPDASVDDTFNIGTGADGYVYSTIIQNDGNIIIAGEFNRYNGVSRNRIARLLSDGSLDVSFNPGSGANGRIREAVLQTDGKIIIVGEFTAYNGITKNGLARLNANGTLDTAFDIGIGVTDNYLGTLYTAVLQPDGKILVGGFFRKINGVSKNGIVRLHPNGSIDESFDSSVGANYGVNAIAIQKDSKIVIGGSFTKYNGMDRNGITRLNADGTLDPAFDKGRGAINGSVLTLGIQEDGKIIAGGGFNVYNNSEAYMMMRLDQNGTLDTTFTSGMPDHSGLLKIVLLKDGKYLISLFGQTYMVRMNHDGSIDQTFPVIKEPSDHIFAIALQKDGKIIIGGGFMFYKGIGRNHLARLVGDLPLGIKTIESTDQILVYPNPSAGTFQINTDHMKDELTGVCVYNAIGEKVYEQINNPSKSFVLDISSKATGVYYIQLKTTKGNLVKKIIKQ